MTIDLSKLSTYPEKALDHLSGRAVRAGIDPRFVGFRSLNRVDAKTLLAHGAEGAREVLYADGVADYPLPVNVSDRSLLPSTRGWWGFSFRDVPSLQLGEVSLIRLKDCKVLGRGDTEEVGYYPAVVTSENTVVDLRETYYKPRMHAELLRGEADIVLDEAVWVAERAYYNHSHWLRSHLPKFALLNEIGETGPVLLPEVWKGVMEESLDHIGFDPSRIRRVPLNARIDVRNLTVVQSSWRRPETVGVVRDAFGDGKGRSRRIYISRAGVTQRRLINEEEVWALFEAAGFESVRMEDHPFEEQVSLMQEAEAVGGLHGAGLTNMIFCAPGTRIVEIGDLTFPNPNFYALASALGHQYWLVRGSGRGEEHPLYRNVLADCSSLRSALSTLG